MKNKTLNVLFFYYHYNYWNNYENVMVFSRK